MNLLLLFILLPVITRTFSILTTPAERFHCIRFEQDGTFLDAEYYRLSVFEGQSLGYMYIRFVDPDDFAFFVMKLEIRCLNLLKQKIYYDEYMK